MLSWCSEVTVVLRCLSEANTLPVPQSPAWVGFCWGRAQQRVANSLFGFFFSHCSWHSQEVTAWAFTMGIVVETSEGCNPWHDTISQLQMNIHPSIFFPNKPLSWSLPYMLFVNTTPPPIHTGLWGFLSLPKVNQPQAARGATEGRCDTAVHAAKCRNKIINILISCPDISQIILDFIANVNRFVFNSPNCLLIESRCRP